MQSLCSSESMRRNFTTLVVANVNEARKGSKKRRPTSTPVETFVKVDQQALQQKINALRETLRLQECSVEKLSDKELIADHLPQELERHCQSQQHEKEELGEIRSTEDYNKVKRFSSHQNLCLFIKKAMISSPIADVTG